MTIAAYQRFTKSNPCPICGGFDDARRGKGERCFGFLADDGKRAFCTREELAGGLPLLPSSSTYAHRLDGRCDCGREHGTGSPSASNGSRSAATVVRTKNYQIRDTAGSPVAEHVRQDLANGEKSFTWRRNGQSGLGGLAVAKVPLYASEKLPDPPDGATVIVAEGETACDALTEHGFSSVGTVTGASNAPDVEVLRALVPFDIVLWPDADDVGFLHMSRIADRLLAMGNRPRMLTWPDAPAKGDAVDFFKAGNTVADALALIDVAPVLESAQSITVPLSRLDSIAAIAHVPDLPAGARLTESMLAAAHRVRSTWIELYVAVATILSPRTPRSLHEDCAIFALLTAIARRAYLRVGPRDIFPSLFLIFIGRSTLSGKTTALDVLRKVIGDAGLLDLLLPASFTPQALLSDLALQVPTTIREGTSQAQLRWLERHRHGAQRAVVRDEAAGLLEDCAKDYNAGLLPLLLKLDGSPDYVDSDLTISRGLVEVRDVGMNFIGTTTPAAFRDHAAKPFHWANGLFGRFALSDSDEDPHWAFWSEEDAKKEINEVVARLQLIYRSLPTPTAGYEYGPAKDSAAILPIVGAKQSGYQPRQAMIDTDAWQAWRNYDQALFTLAARDDSSERLDPTYGRLASAAIRVALALAVADWALTSDDHLAPVRVQIGHWAAAQQIAERWRASAHRILANALRSEESEGQTRHASRLRKLLDEHDGKMSRGDVLRSLNWTAEQLDTAIGASNKSITSRKEKTGGRPAEWVELAPKPTTQQGAGPPVNGHLSAFGAFASLVGLVDSGLSKAIQPSKGLYSDETTKEIKGLKALKTDSVDGTSDGGELTPLLSYGITVDDKENADPQSPVSEPNDKADCRERYEV